MDNFLKCLAFTLQAEGGYSDNPQDPGNWTGGAIGCGVLLGTNCGISAASYPSLDIQNLTTDQINAIYRQDYYEAIKADFLPLPLAMVGFDAAVNAGVGRSIRWLQQASGVVVDGIIGPKTLAALNMDDPMVIAVNALACRIDFYAELSTWPNFGHGWVLRTLKLSQEICKE